MTCFVIYAIIKTIAVVSSPITPERDCAQFIRSKS